MGPECSSIYIEIMRSFDISLSSDLYKKYLCRLADLEVKFARESLLKQQFQDVNYNLDPTSIFEQDDLKALRLLCHAETEYILESLADKLSNLEYKNWKEHGIPSDVVINIVATHYSGWDKLDCSVKEYKPFTEQQLRKHDGLVTMAATEKAYSAYKHNLLNNHGIKEANFRNMFVPLGVLERDFIDLVRNMEAFGLARGVVAHSGNAVKSLINPVDEKKLITDIAKGIYELDCKIEERLNNQGTAMMNRLKQMKVIVEAAANNV